MDWDWNVVRFELFNALDALNVHEIFLVEKEHNVVALSLIVEEVGKIRPLLRMRIIDDLISRKAPELYRQYIFTYEVWDKGEWDMLPASKFYCRGLVKRPF